MPCIKDSKHRGKTTHFFFKIKFMSPGAFWIWNAQHKI